MEKLPTRARASLLGLMARGALVLASTGVQAQDKSRIAQVEFGSEFFRGSTPVDVTRFGLGNVLPAGSYRVDIYVNGRWIGRDDVLFRANPPQPSATPCFSPAQLDVIGVDVERLSEDARTALLTADAQSCLRLEALVPDATAQFDSGDLRLDVSIPQISLRRTARGYVRPELWDDGVNAAMLGYHFNTFSTSQAGASNTSYFLSLNSGVNLGGWRFRNNSTLIRQSSGPSRVQTLSSYAQRSIAAVDGLLTLGDASTSGQLFDSFAYRGVQLSSDLRMLPDSQSGYAPVVRGLARTNAKVQVRQNGAIIYETTVAPGRFEINDLYPTGFGGNLNVQVTESDGSVSSFDVPYASVAQLLRPGAYRYGLTAGRTRSAYRVESDNFVQATYEHGLNNILTLSGGLLLARDYLSLVGGGAVSTPLGAMALNLTGSQARVGGEQLRGQSLKLDYNKNLVETGTHIALAAFRYSSGDYLRLQDLQALKALAAAGRGDQFQRLRSQFQVSLSQSLGQGYGAFYAVGSTQNYWRRDGTHSTYSLGYSNQWNSISYNFSAQRQREQVTGRSDTQYQFTMSMPLGREVQSPTMSLGVTSSPSGGNALQSSLAGTVGQQSELSYSATVSRAPGASDRSATTNTDVNAQYRTSVANLGASAGYGSGGRRQMSATASGGLVAYAGGVMLAQGLGETIAIVRADGAAGAALNVAGVSLGRDGTAVVPYLTPFRNNEVVIDPKGTSTDVELKTTSLRVAPVAGAVVLMHYETVTGRSVLINAYQANGQVLPFGADVLDEQGNVLGMVGQGGAVFVRTQGDSGRLVVRWGSGRDARCQLRYALGPRETQGRQLSFDQLNAVCEPINDAVAQAAQPEVTLDEARM